MDNMVKNWACQNDQKFSTDSITTTSGSQNEVQLWNRPIGSEDMNLTKIHYFFQCSCFVVYFTIVVQIFVSIINCLMYYWWMITTSYLFSFDIGSNTLDWKQLYTNREWKTGLQHTSARAAVKTGLIISLLISSNKNSWLQLVILWSFNKNYTVLCFELSNKSPRENIWIVDL